MGIHFFKLGFPLKACGNDRISFLRFTHNFVVERDTYDASYLIAGIINRLALFSAVPFAAPVYV